MKQLGNRRTVLSKEFSLKLKAKESTGPLDEWRFFLETRAICDERRALKEVLDQAGNDLRDLATLILNDLAGLRAHVDPDKYEQAHLIATTIFGDAQTIENHEWRDIETRIILIQQAILLLADGSDSITVRYVQDLAAIKDWSKARLELKYRMLKLTPFWGEEL